MKKILLSTALLSITSLSAVGHETSVTYEAKRGFAETFSVTQIEQLGKFKVVLKPIAGSEFHHGKASKSHKRKGSKHHNKDKFILKGLMKGTLNADFTLNHVFVSKDRTGVLYTQNDSITMVYAGDPTCENGTGSVPFEVEETLNIVSGTGIYAGIEAGSFIVVKGVVNNCPSLPEFGQNNFDIVGGTVTIIQ